MLTKRRVESPSLNLGHTHPILCHAFHEHCPRSSSLANPCPLFCLPTCLSCASPCSIIRGPNLKGLRELDLSSFSFDGAAVSDATMAAIATNLTALSRLHLPRGSVTAAGKRQVLAVLPGVAIDC